MEYDSATNCDDRMRDFAASEDSPLLRETQKVERSTCTTAVTSSPWNSLEIAATQPKPKPGTTNRSLSSQVMECYQKYSQSANLDQYFSLRTANTSPETFKYYYSINEIISKPEANRQDCVGEEYGSRCSVPRERRRWARPPLIGQSSNTETSPTYVQTLSNLESPSPDVQHVGTGTILEERNETQEILVDGMERKISSPTSSIASHKPLEWDSGADVGYFNLLPSSKHCDKKLSTIERMALATGCSAALRLDPEGTTESGISGKLVRIPKNLKSSAPPDANSTPMPGNASGSDSEIEITPIVKNHLPGILTGNNIKSNDTSSSKDYKKQYVLLQYSRKECSHDTSKPAFVTKVPLAKHMTELRKVTPKANVYKENIQSLASPLKKSTSMNTLAIPPTKVKLKRSKSELNLHARDKNKATLPLIFNSSSSLATIVNKPATCDKVIQTSLYAYSQESIGVQVSVHEEERPPLPKRGTSLQKGPAGSAKNPRGTYTIQNSRKPEPNRTQSSLGSERSKESKRRPSYSEQSRNGSGTPQPVDETENITGRANSFEYFPGHVYENVPNGSGSHISSTETGRSHSTLPNTSSSINDKLWGDSDSLVRDLERSVNILKSLVDANKCDKEVKKRLIHHVVKRLITAKYTDDKIEHNLEDNIPWNPDDTRSKVYEREILRALTKKRDTSNSSGDWNPDKQIPRGKLSRNEREIMKGIQSQTSSDKIDKNTDRTEIDGRKARMGLRSDDCPRSTNTTTDRDKSESSECFFPQRSRKGNKVQDIFSAKQRCKATQRDSTTTNTTPPDHNRLLLDAVVDSRRMRSTNSEDQANWRLLTTFSERQFELKKWNNSDSGDSKLVSYAEMEKRNQLIWITNEISHLCNLKKLLEEPRKSERPRTSPKKSRSANVKTKAMNSLSHLPEFTKEEDYLLRNGINQRMNSTENPWSSHCNLAACQHSSGSNSMIQHIKKRNSCAQTATNVTSAHSKTGGEIVSASSIRNSTIKLISTGVQTVPQETSTVPALIQSEIVHYVKCPAHDVIHIQNSCKNIEQVGQYLKHPTVQNVVTTCMQCLQTQKGQTGVPQKSHGNMENSQEESSVRASSDMTNGIIGSSAEVIHQCVSKEVQTSPVVQKEAKNQINASKSRICDCKNIRGCKCINDCDCDTKETSSKGCQSCAVPTNLTENNLGTKCAECLKVAQQRSHGKSNGHVGKECNCANVHEDDEDRTNKNQAPMRYSSKYRQSNNIQSNQNGYGNCCGCSNDSSCECNRNKPDSRNVKIGYVSCHMNGKAQHNAAHCCGHYTETDDRSTQPWPCRVTNGQIVGTSQYKVQSFKCDCGNDCFRNNVGKNDDTLHGRTCGKPNHANETKESYDSDRDYTYCRLCGAAYQNTRRCNCYQTYPKAIAYEISFSGEDNRINDNSGALPKVPLSNRVVNDGKTVGCVCNVIKGINSKRGSPQKDTLQDYLTKNKAEFVNNAETRRQYMSEISQLRLLRKQKRIQLLAMASTSNILKSPKVSKPAVHTQKKVTDEEMKDRLRKRYLRLNEVRQKRRQREKQEEARRNKLMAKIFCKKLQQKVLRGQVDLSQSVSVISNM